MCQPNHGVCKENPERPYLELIKREGIDLIEGKICHDGDPCTFKFNEHRITIGCHTITPDAMRFILSNWDEKFLHGPKDFTIQP